MFTGRSFSASRLLLPMIAFLALLAPARPAQANACQWTGASSTNWATAGNWSSCGGITPQSTDTATIPSGGNQPNIQSGTSVTVGQVTVNTSATLTVSSGGSLTLNNGLTGGGNLTVSGAVTFFAGTMDGAGTTTIQSGGTAALSNGAFFLGRAFVNAGTTTFTSSGYFYMQAGSSVSNTGTVDIQHNTYAFYGSAAGLTVTNTGTIMRTTSSGTANIYNVAFTNTSPGTVSVSSGTLDLYGVGTVTDTGSFSASGGGILQFDGSGTTSVSGAVTGTNVSFTGSPTITFTGTYSATNTTIASGTVNFNEASTVTMGSLTMTSGTLAGSANINVTTLHISGGTITGSGTMTLVAAGTGTLDSSAVFLSRPFVNAGTTTLSNSGYFYMQAGGSFVNQSTGVVEIQHNTYAFYGSANGLTVANTGHINRTTSAGTATIYNVVLTNTSPGVVSVSTGTLDISTQGTSTHSGSFTASAGATLQFSGNATNTISGAVSGPTINFAGSQTTTLTGTYSGATTNLIGGTANFNQSSITVTNLNATGGTGNFNQSSTVALASVTLTSGTIGGTANITVSSVFHAGSGTVTGSGTMTLASSCTGTLDSSAVFLSRPLVNAGPITLSSNGYFYMQAGASFTNQSTGTVEAQHNTYVFYGAAAGLPVVNTGSITRTTSSGTADIYNVVLTNTSPGTVTVSSGTLDVSTTGTSTDTGSFTGSAGATLQFSGNATTSISGAVTGPNVIFASSPTTTLTGTYSVTNTTISGGTVNFNEASAVAMPNLTMSGGTLSGSANVNVTTTLHVTSGTMSGTGTTTLANGGTGTFDSSNLTLARPFVNAGGLTLSAGGSAYFYMQAGASFNNQSTGTIDIQHNTYAFYGSTTGMNVTNTGHINRSTSSGTADIYNVVFTNTSPGTVTVSSGTLDISTTGTSTSTGSFTVSPGSTLQFSGNGTTTITGSISGPNVIFASSPTITLTGTYSVTNTTISGATVNFNEASAVALSNLTMTGGTLSGTANVNVTTLHVSSGTMSGTGTTTLLAAGTGTFDSSSMTLSRPFVSAGAITFTAGGNGYFYMQAGGTFTNQAAATIDVQHNTYAFYGGAAGVPVNNAGTISRTTSSGIAYIYNVAFTNTGTLQSLSGTFAVSNYTQTSGQTILNGGDFNTNGTTWSLNGGILKGNGTITGNLNNGGGNVSPGASSGAAGSFTIVGNYTQTSGGTLTIDVNGTTPGTQYDQLNIQGTITLGGNLALNPTISPPSGVQFEIMTNDFSDAITGSFAGSPEGHVIVTPNGNFRISYIGDTGNDVVLSSIAAAKYYTVQPCRVADTRGATGPYGGPALAGANIRNFVITGQCGIPVTATAVSFNFTITQSTNPGDIRVFPGGASLPLVSSLNFGIGQTRANNAIVTLGPSGDIGVRLDQPAGTAANLIIDVNGYFQ